VVPEHFLCQDLKDGGRYLVREARRREDADRDGLVAVVKVLGVRRLGRDAAGSCRATFQVAAGRRERETWEY
jgi:hypothetical protein